MERPGSGAHARPEVTEAIQIEETVEPEELSLDRESWRPTGFLEWFVVGQTVLPAFMYFPGSQSFRFPIRVAAFAISLLAFAMWWFGRGGRRPFRHPADRWLVLVLLCLSLMITHPYTASLFAGTGQLLLYFAVFCPVFWVPGYVGGRRRVVRVLAILMVCNGIDSAVGVMQVYDPDRWMPRELSQVFTGNIDMMEGSMFVGRMVASSCARQACSIRLAPCAARALSRRSWG